jgi:hypothetical protein
MAPVHRRIFNCQQCRGLSNLAPTQLWAAGPIEMRCLMTAKDYAFRAIFSSDWNECLAPCGPFDVMAFHYPGLSAALHRIFKQYTGNAISLGQAVRLLDEVLPAPITKEQMDAYLEESFKMYKGVDELIRWCNDYGILFMINTTGMIGYFQRAFAMGLLPRVPALSANPAIRFPGHHKGPHQTMPLKEIADKAVNTQRAIHDFRVNPQKIMIMGDSGGDGPHFKWGSDQSAYIIGSMTKLSLRQYCQNNALKIDHQFGISYREGGRISRHDELQVDFMDLVPVIEDYLQRS